MRNKLNFDPLKITIAASELMAHACHMCGDFTAPTFQLLQVHLFRVHSGDFRVSCCNAEFRSASAYRKHLQRHHKNLDSASALSYIPVAAEQNSLSTSSESFDTVNDNDYEDHDSSCSVNLSQVNVAMWILKLKETNKLTQTCVDGVLQHVTELCTSTVLELGEAVKLRLASAGINIKDIPGLQDLFTASSHLCQPFEGLLTYHHQLKFYSSNLKFIVSCCYILVNDFRPDIPTQGVLMHGREGWGGGGGLVL